MNISTLKNQIGAGANTSKFMISIPVPMLLRAGNFANKLIQKIPLIGGIISDGNTSVPGNDEIRVLCKATTFPEKSINTINIMHRGHAFVVRSTAEFSHKWDVTFYNTADLNLRHFFEGWIYNIDKFDNVVNFGPIGPTLFPSNYMGAGTLNSGYMTDLKVHQLCNDKITAGYEFSYAFPIAISATELNASTPNIISEFTVTFAYSYWKPYTAGPFAALGDLFG
jgi:hypothetical protein